MTNKPRVMVTLTDKENKTIRQIAEEKNLSISKLTEILIRNGIKRMEEKEDIIL